MASNNEALKRGWRRLVLDSLHCSIDEHDDECLISVKSCHLRVFLNGLTTRYNDVRFGTFDLNRRFVGVHPVVYD